MKQTSNAERPTPNAERRASAFPVVGRWTLDVGRLLWLILAIALGLLFIYTGALKVWDPVGFASDIENYHMLPWRVGVLLAFYLPWLEIVTGFSMLLGRYRKGGTSIATAMMIVFIVATVIAKVRGIDVSCGCFGHAARNLSFASHMAIDVTILRALIAVLCHGNRRVVAGTNPG